MINHYTEKRIARFYQWERAGRGITYSPTPVELEPFFEPFAVKEPFEKAIDDGKVKSLFSHMGDAFKLRSARKQNKSEEFQIMPEEGALKIICITVPQDLKVRVSDANEFLLMLHSCKRPVAFEIIAGASAIQIQFACRDNDVNTLTNQLKAFFPSCISEEKEAKPFVKSLSKIALSDFHLEESFIKPTRVLENFDIDLQTSLFSILDSMDSGELAIIQILFSTAKSAWSESMLRAVSNYNGQGIFLDNLDLAQHAKEKVRYPLYVVSVRTAVQTNNTYRSKEFLDQMNAAIIGMSKSPLNSFALFTCAEYDTQQRLTDINLRQCHRPGMILNSRELINFVHLPTGNIHSQKLNRKTKKAKLAPCITKSEGLFIGINEYHGTKQDVNIPNNIQGRHCFISGATGSGKSNLMLQMISGDIESGKGIIVVDPHGQLIDDLLPIIPNKRVGDVILFDPADDEYPIGLNILEAHSETERNVITSDLTAIIKKYSNSFGDQMYSILANSIQALLESEQGGTLIDLRKFLVEKKHRETILKTVKNPSLNFFWHKEFPLLKTASIGPITVRLDSFLRTSIVRNIVAQKAGISFEGVLSSNKILLAKLPIGLIGNENSFLLGTLLVTKVLQAAMARRVSAEDRPCAFYVDECQNFLSFPSIITLLESGRKFLLNLVLTTQSLSALEKQDADLASAIIANTATKIFFRLGDIDAKKTAQGFSFFDSPADFLNLSVGEAIVRLERADWDFNLAASKVEKGAGDKEKAAQIIERSRKLYGIHRSIIEKSILESFSEKEQLTSRSNKTILRSPLYTEAPKSDEPDTPIVFNAEEKAKELLTKKTESQHRYQQNLIKRLAESKGFKASIEAPTPDNSGRVDVLIEKGQYRIAIEVSISTPIEWEVTNNITKCLKAGYDGIISCISNNRSKKMIEQKISEIFSAEELKKIKVLTIEELIAYFNHHLEERIPNEKTIKGYKVKVEFDLPPEDVIKQKQDFLTEIILSSQKQKK